MIKIENLSYRYPRASDDGAKEASDPGLALKGINLHIKKGEYAAIVGHNGSGKSTLAKHMNALLIPSGGTITINGLDSSVPENVWRIRQCAGMVFQNPDNQIIATVVEEDVAFGPENLGVAPDEIRASVDDALLNVGMLSLASHSPHFLSGGQKQRIAIAGVLAMRPELIILDEPTAMLDPSGRRDVLDSVYKLNRENGITIVFITHYMDEAVRADRVIVMEDGEIAMDGLPREIYKNADKLKVLGLDVPQTVELRSRLINAGCDISGEIISIEELADEICKLRLKT